MKLNAYSIYDQAAAAYMRPFFTEADGRARRMFGDLANDPDHDIGKHPKDYSVWRIGIFDDQKGQLIPEQGECLATALEMQALHNNHVADTE